MKELAKQHIYVAYGELLRLGTHLEREK